MSSPLCRRRSARIRTRTFAPACVYTFHVFNKDDDDSTACCDLDDIFAGLSSHLRADTAAVVADERFVRDFPAISVRHDATALFFFQTGAVVVKDHISRGHVLRVLDRVMGAWQRAGLPGAGASSYDATLKLEVDALAWLQQG